jgi:hypothetical protein
MCALATSITACCLLFSGCSLNINSRDDAYYIPSTFSGNDYVYDLSFLVYFDYALKVNNNFTSATLIEVADSGNSFDRLSYPAVLCGNDFPNYTNDYAEGYEALPELLKSKYESAKVAYTQYYAVEYDSQNKIAYGFCNLYSGACGFLSGGGNICVDKIVAGVYFSYSPLTGEFVELNSYTNCNLVAVNTKGVIYYKDKKYYANCGTETYICDDEAFDTGITNYSNVEVLFDSNICIIAMKRGYDHHDKDFMKIVVSTYTANILYSDKIFLYV